MGRWRGSIDAIIVGWINEVEVPGGLAVGYAKARAHGLLPIWARAFAYPISVVTQLDAICRAILSGAGAPHWLRPCRPTSESKGRAVVIRLCDDTDVEVIHEIINDGANAYRGVIPEDRWKEPYMSVAELRHEISDGVRFWGEQIDGVLVGVMGIQDVQDVTLIRHAYVRTANCRQGIGGKLLSHLRELASRPLLIGTWADATWATAFYDKHGFRLLTPE